MFLEKIFIASVSSEVFHESSHAFLPAAQLESFQASPKSDSTCLLDGLIKQPNYSLAIDMAHKRHSVEEHEMQKNLVELWNWLIADMLSFVGHSTIEQHAKLTQKLRFEEDKIGEVLAEILQSLRDEW